MGLNLGPRIGSLLRRLGLPLASRGEPGQSPVRDGRVKDDEQDIRRMLETFRGLITELSRGGDEIEQICARAEQKAARFAVLSQTVVESVSSGILVVDNSDRVLLANSSAKRILDIESHAAIVGVGLDTLFRDGREFKRLVRQCVETGANFSRKTLEMVTPAGKRKRLGISATCFGAKPRPVEAVILVFALLGDESDPIPDEAEGSREAAERQIYLRGVLDSYDLISSLIMDFSRIEAKSNRGTLTMSELRGFSRSMRRACDTMMAFALSAGIEDSIPEIVDVNEILQSVIVRLDLENEPRLKKRLSNSLPRVKTIRKVLEVGLGLLIRGSISQSPGGVEITSRREEGKSPYSVAIDVRELSPSRPVVRVGGSLRDFIGGEDTQREAGLFLLSKLQEESHVLQVEQGDGFFHFSMAIESPIEKESGPGRRTGGAPGRGG